jgi:hypothetical protein
VTSGDQIGICSDDGCFWGGTGPSLNITNTAEDVCYMIRVAGFFDDDGAEWLDQQLDITCQTGGLGCDPATASSDGLEKNRYLGIDPGLCTGAASSIKVTITANPANPGTVGQIWWAGPTNSITNTPNPALLGSGLQCNPGTPHSQVWPAGNLHLHGNAIRPEASYSIEICDAAGANCSTPLAVDTALWGDVTAPFFPGSPNEPSFADISACVDKFKNLASAPDQVFTDLGGAGTASLDFGTNFADIGADVDAFKNVPYPYATATCP